jgi:hypothetical protein
MQRRRWPPGDVFLEVEMLPVHDLGRRMREETLLFVTLFCADLGDRLAGEGGVADPAWCDACGRADCLVRLVQSAYALEWTILPDLVVACSVPAERPEDGWFWLWRRCWAPAAARPGREG